MDLFKAMRVFREVANQNSFSKAATTLRMVNSAVSRQVSELEGWLGCKLIYRTTRSLSLTDYGQLYLQQIDTILDSVDELERQATSSQEIVKGRLRITAPTFLGRYYLESLLPEFLEKFPEIHISLLLVDRHVNLVEEGYDLAIRVGHLQESTLIARQLSTIQLKTAASPTYLKERGVPETPESLDQHNCLLDTVARTANKWSYQRDKREFNMAVTGNMDANNGETIRQMAVNGAGVCYLPSFLVDESLTSGSLQEILAPYCTAPVPVSVVYPFNRLMSNALRTFIDYLINSFDEC